MQPFLCVLQLVRECKEVLRGGLLMKQYYQYMLRGVVTDPQGLQSNTNIDDFEEDLHKMLMVGQPTAWRGRESKKALESSLRLQLTQRATGLAF